MHPLGKRRAVPGARRSISGPNLRANADIGGMFGAL
jgi:hypothetical protein